MKIYTKIGDQGQTQFFGCGLVSKDDPRIEALGALDELNSVLGVTLTFIQDEPLIQAVKQIQNDLFQVGADLAGSALGKDQLPRVKEEHISALEKNIDELEALLGMPQKFILPGGTPASSFLYLTRTVARRAERSLVRASKTINLNPEMLKYINRLSDYLYVLARKANKEVEIKEQHPLYNFFEGN